MKKKYAYVLVHVLGWALFFLLPILLHPSAPPDMPQRPEGNEEHIYISFVINSLLLMPFFYANVYAVFPKVINTGKYWYLLPIQTGFLVLFLGISRLVESFWEVGSNGAPTIFLLLVFLLTNLFGLCYFLIKHHIAAERAKDEIENELLKTELQFLRWQISPHFLFNVLNNMAATARLKPDQLEPMILKLSNLLRYMLYDGGEHRISLNKELEYLNSYIYLQSVRLGSHFAVNVNINVPNADDYLIEPMLLIPFVENAFKHGSKSVSDPFIDVQAHLFEGKLLFEIRNRFGETDNKSEAKGIGLVNVRKRLKMLYGTKANLVTEKANSIFTVVLALTLV